MDDSHSAGLGQGLADGQLQLSAFSIEQLRALRPVLDAGRYPLNAALLEEELRRREATASTSDGCNDEWPVRFTAADGWLGWWQARRQWAPCHGSGYARIAGDALELGGWRRTWLGSADRREWKIPFGRLRNVAVEGQRVWLEYRTHWARWRRLGIGCSSPEAAQALAARLPTGQTSHFKARWAALSEFRDQLERAGVRPWVTYLLVASNAVLFLLFVLVNHAWSGSTWTDLLAWGANYGPQTTGGQGWRLFTALFLHGSLLHLAANLWVLWNAGRLTERLFGNGRYALVYLGSGLLASLASIAWQPSTITLGASGAIFGVLGAFLAFALAPRCHLPWQVLRTHWVSTAVFVLFSLANGLMNVGIDNAAHVGGLVGGFLLGLVLARPLASPAGMGVEQSGWPRWAAPVGAAAATAVVVALGYWQLDGLAHRVTPPTAYLKAHAGFVTGEQRSLQRWSEIGSKMDQGALSPAEFARQFRAEILPFWQETKAKMEEEQDRLPEDQKPYAQDLISYVAARLVFVREAIAAAEDGRTSASLVEENGQQIQRAMARLERRRINANADLAPLALANTTWASRLRAGFGLGAKCVESPLHLLHAGLDKDSPTDGPAQLHGIGCKAQQAFLARDFATLELLAAQYPPDDSDPVEGLSRHGAAINGLSDLFQYGQLTLEEAVSSLAQWRARYPGSIQPHLVEAEMYVASAWAARGNGYAKEVAQQQWQAFNLRLAMAAAALGDIERRAKEDPEWNVIRLKEGLGASEPRADLGQVYSEGVQRYPRFLALAGQWLHVLMPRWGGSLVEVDAVIRQRAQAWGEQADEAYARLYSHYADMEGDEEPLYEENRIDWERVQKGYQSLMQRYPFSDHLVNSYAYLACRSGRWPDYREIRPRLNGHVSATAWGYTHTLAWCDGKAR